MHALQRARVALFGSVLILLALPGVSLAGAEGTGADAAAPPARVKRVVKDLIMDGDARCTRCHSDVAGDIVETYPVLPIGRTRHGVRADARTPTCVSCHGDSERHLKQDGRTRPLPDRPFGRKRPGVETAAQDQACLTCHEGGKLMHWDGGAHARADVGCNSCHQLHAPQDRATARERIADTCMACHKDKRAQFAKPSHHPVPEGRMTCTDCHNPHGTAGPKLLARDSVNETCFSCHAQYRGPFLWNHLPVTQDCALCHNPHGTTTDNLLKARAPFLCQQCHDAASHRGNFPGLDGVQSNSPGASGLTQARGCPNCHNNIHGGSNPTSTGSQRTFRR